MSYKAPSKHFKRPCRDCDKDYRPTGKYQKYCDECKKKRNSARYKNDPEELKIQYFKTKEELDIIRDNATLAKWKILSKAYKLGKQIWGTRFTRQRLAYDMEMPMTTVLRCLSLDRANKKSMRLMKQGKISAFKLAMICASKSKTYQDEIVDLVIKEKYSTHQIKSLRVNNLKDVNLERLRLAVEDGFSRRSSAACGFENWISRGNMFLLLKKDALEPEKMEEIRESLRKLNRKIDGWIDG